MIRNKVIVMLVVSCCGLALVAAVYRLPSWSALVIGLVVGTVIGFVEKWMEDREERKGGNTHGKQWFEKDV